MIFKFLLRLIPLYGIASLIAFILFMTGTFYYGHPMDSAGPGVVITCVVLFFISVFAIISTIVSIFSHIENLGKLRSFDLKIQNEISHADLVREESEKLKKHLEGLKEGIMKLDESLLAKAADHPIVAAMKNVMEVSDDIVAAEKSIKEMKNRKLNTQSIIESRKIGPFGWVVEVYGEK